VISGITKQDKYCAILVDYDWYAGQGDALEVSGGGLKFHVGHCDTTHPVPPALKEQLSKLNYTSDTLPRLPSTSPKDGWSFPWSPDEGEVFAAGPKASKPFRLYASSKGPMADGHPAYPHTADPTYVRVCS